MAKEKMTLTKDDVGELKILSPEEKAKAKEVLEATKFWIGMIHRATVRKWVLPPNNLPASHRQKWIDYWCAQANHEQHPKLPKGVVPK